MVEGVKSLSIEPLRLATLLFLGFFVLLFDFAMILFALSWVNTL